MRPEGRIGATIEGSQQGPPHETEEVLSKARSSRAQCVPESKQPNGEAAGDWSPRRPVGAGTGSGGFTRRPTRGTRRPGPGCGGRGQRGFGRGSADGCAAGRAEECTAGTAAGRGCDWTARRCPWWATRRATRRSGSRSGQEAAMARSGWRKAGHGTQRSRGRRARTGGAEAGGTETIRTAAVESSGGGAARGWAERGGTAEYGAKNDRATKCGTQADGLPAERGFGTAAGRCTTATDAAG